MEAATQIASLLLEVERAQVRGGAAPTRQADGAAPLIGSSEAIRRVRERIERVAATDFTVLIEGHQVQSRIPIYCSFGLSYRRVI